MTDIVHTLRHELVAIEADVAKLETEAAKLQARLRLSLDKAEKVKAVLTLYAGEEIPEQQPRLFASFSAGSTATATIVRKVTTAGSSGKSKAFQIKVEVSDLLNARGTEHRQKILDHLVGKGLMGHEKDPLASLAAYLSNYKDVFMADGRGNFSLRRDSQREPPPAPEGAGSAEVKEAKSELPKPSTTNMNAMEGQVS